MCASGTTFGAQGDAWLEAKRPLRPLFSCGWHLSVRAMDNALRVEGDLLPSETKQRRAFLEGLE